VIKIYAAAIILFVAVLLSYFEATGEWLFNVPVVNENVMNGIMSTVRDEVFTCIPFFGYLVDFLNIGISYRAQYYGVFYECIKTMIILFTTKIASDIIYFVSGKNKSATPIDWIADIIFYDAIAVSLALYAGVLFNLFIGGYIDIFGGTIMGCIVLTAALTGVYFFVALRSPFLRIKGLIGAAADALVNFAIALCAFAITVVLFWAKEYVRYGADYRDLIIMLLSTIGLPFAMKFLVGLKIKYQ
jgi:hypothetical protein